MKTPKMLLFLIFLFIGTGTSNPWLITRRVDSGLTSNLSTKSAENDLQSCVCFNKGRPPITEVLNSNPSHLERLVVYIYRDSDSNSLQLYTPNKEKQVQFPDLGWDDGELLQVGHETVYHVFDTNTNSVNVEKLQKEADEIDINDHVLEYQVYEATTPKYDDLQADTANLLTKEQVTETGDLQSPLDQDLNLNVTQSAEQYPIVVATNVIEPSVTVTKSKSISLDETQKPSSESHEASPVVRLPLIDVMTGSYVSPYNSDSSIQTLLPLDPVLVSPAEVLAPSTKKYTADKLITESDIKENQLPKAAVTNGFLGGGSGPELSSGLESLTNTIDGELSRSTSVPYMNTFNPTSTQAGTVGSIGNEYVTFDSWFAQQMKNIQQISKSPTKNMHLSSLKHLIEKTLFENGLYVTKDGVLTDSRANALNVANLKLRPFLIGDSVEYNNLFSVGDGDKYELPANLPYLESVLVTLLDPPKILGVIPLGKTFVPRVSYRTGLDYWAWKARNNMADCKSYLCKLKRTGKYQYYHKLASQEQQNSVSSSVGQLMKEASMKGTSKIRNRSRSNYTSQRQKHNQYQYRFDLDKVLKALKSVIFPGPAQTSNRKAYEQKVEYPGLPINEDLIGQNMFGGNVDDEELPGFRIIGGMPATSSGTPLSSKGRAGYDFE